MICVVCGLLNSPWCACNATPAPPVATPARIRLSCAIHCPPTRPSAAEGGVTEAESATFEARKTSGKTSAPRVAGAQLPYSVTPATPLGTRGRGAVESWSREIVKSWSRGAVELWSRGIVEPWSRGAVESWSRGVVESWSHGVMELWSRGVEIANPPSIFPQYRHHNTNHRPILHIECPACMYIEY